MVAVGDLDRIWLAVPEDVSLEELQMAFYNYFGSKWAEVLNAAQNSFAYHAFNNAYFSVRDVRPLENLTLDLLLEEKGIIQPSNIIVS